MYTYKIVLYPDDKKIVALQVEPSKLVQGRCYHSNTATSLWPNLTEVLVFGGIVQWAKQTPIAETNLLRFGENIKDKGLQ